MTEKEFADLCQARGYRLTGSGKAVGTELGWPVTLIYGKKTLTLCLPAEKGERKLRARGLKRGLRERLGRNASTIWGNGFVAVYLKLKGVSDPYNQEIRPALEAFRDAGFTVPDSCKICGRSGCDSIIPSGPAFHPAHRTCVEKDVRAVKEKAEKNDREGSFLLGLLGAVLGMAVGVVPSALTIILASRIYVILFMLIPICTYYGYRLFHGKMNRAALVLSVLLSAVGVYLLNYVLLVYNLGSRYDLSFGQTLSLLPAAVRDPSVFTAITRDEDFFECVIFAVLGIFLAWGQISRTNKHLVRDAQASLDNLFPYGDTQAEQSGETEETPETPEEPDAPEESDAPEAED